MPLCYISYIQCFCYNLCAVCVCVFVSMYDCRYWEVEFVIAVCARKLFCQIPYGCILSSDVLQKWWGLTSPFSLLPKVTLCT